MAGVETVERLRQFLGELSPKARALLTSEFERSLLRGDEVAGAELILEQLRRIMRDQREGAPRVNHAARYFFRPLEPFMVDDAGNHKHSGRIARSSLELLWAWVRRDLLPDEATAFSAEMGDPLISGDEQKARTLAHALQDRVAAAIEASFEAAAADDKVQRRLLAQIGTARAQDDAATLLCVLKGRDLLVKIAGNLPLQIGNLGPAQLEDCMAMVETTAARDDKLFLYALLTVLHRLAAPWQLIRFGTKAAGSNVAARVAETRYSVAVTIALAELERQIGELRKDLRSGYAAGVGALLKRIHDAVRGLRTELALPVDSTWGRALAAQRAQIAELLRCEIDSVPGRVRRLLRARFAGDTRSASGLDVEEVAETASLVEFVCTCRHYAGELALNEITQRSFNELEHYLDTAVRALMEALRQAEPDDRPFVASQLDAARRFCASVFGENYAAELARTAHLASLHERAVAQA